MTALPALRSRSGHPRDRDFHLKAGSWIGLASIAAKRPNAGRSEANPAFPKPAVPCDGLYNIRRLHRHVGLALQDWKLIRQLAGDGVEIARKGREDSFDGSCLPAHKLPGFVARLN